MYFSLAILTCFLLTLAFLIIRVVRHDGELVKLIVTKVLSELKKAFLVVTDCLVGVDNNVKEIMEMIGTNMDDVKVMGIHGMGGIGKTTLAKIVYNKLCPEFDHCCFLKDVSEASNSKGIVYLQNCLISALSKQALPFANYVEDGIRMIEERLSSEKALILLDDVNEKSQLTALLGSRCCFGPGSHILITTRNILVLRQFDVKLIYQVHEMDSNRSLQLFSKHAFRRGWPPPEKLELSREVVKFAQGVPLVLEVMGSTLSMCGQRKESWGEYLEKWKMGPIEEIQNKLMISYEALDPCQKQIFLDIACLFIGCDKHDAMYMWRDFRLCPTQNLEVLQMMSLIKIEKGNKFWMHDCLKDLGRDIVSRESGGHLAQNSRLWNYEEASDVLMRKERNESLEALRLNADEFGKSGFALEGFAALPKVRFLRVDSKSLNSGSTGFLSKAALLWHTMSWILSPKNILGGKKQLLPNLRWLMWHNFPWWALRMTYFSMNSLIILDFSHSRITHDWDGWRHIKGGCKLKVLNLTRCSLTKTPDLSELLTLERLILDYCFELAEIDSSIGKVKNLIFLSLMSCRRLHSLPEELGGLPNLEELLLDGTAIREIPDWWDLKKLEDPDLHDYPAVNASGCINHPTSLSNLSLQDTPIAHLPYSIEALTSLERLNLKRCRHINRLPYFIGKLRSLTELNLFDTGITELPYSMESLENLKTLIVAVGVGSQGISALPKLPGSLTSLVVKSNSLKTIPDLSNLINLKKLMLSMGMPNISSLSERVQVPMPWWLGRLSKLQNLTLRIPHMTTLSPELGALSHLKFLYLWGCRGLQYIPQISSSVSKLYITSCHSLTTLDISTLKNLSELYIMDTPVEDLCGHELLDNLLGWKIDKGIACGITIEAIVKEVLEEHSFINI